MGRLHNEDEFGFIDDVADFVSDRVDDVGDVASSAIDMLGDVVKAIPGGEWVIDGADAVGGVVGDFVKGPLRDFSRTTVGEIVVRAFSIMLQNAAYLVPYVGYTLALMTLSIPGMAKGDRFDKAFIDETAYRIEKVIEYFAGDAGGALTDEAKKYYNETLSDEIRNGVDAILASAESMGISPKDWIVKTNMTPEKLASAIGTREDMAAMALDWVNGDAHKLKEVNSGEYDLATGKRIKRLGKRKLPVAGAKKSTGPVDPCVSLANAKRMGQNKAIIDALTKKCQHYRQTKAGASMNMVSTALKALTAKPTLGKRKTPTGKSAGPSTRNPCEIYEAAKAAGQKPVILAALKPKCDAYAAEQAAKAATLAASTAVTTAPVDMAPATESVFNSETNQKSAIAGVISGAVGAGGALLAGLSAGIAIPVGLSFAAGGAIATKLLSKPKSAG